ncbi:hypothetical protein EBB07_20925 [Paenibacillaceae bacterium]|nr:hypothetical protein EBB07_20925 [Paenibacillaceae bacterium]
MENKKRNSISVLLYVAGVGVWGIGFLVGVMSGQPDEALQFIEDNGSFNFKVAFAAWGRFGVIGLLIIGLSEVIHLLQQLNDKFSHPAKEDTLNEVGTNDSK